MKKNRSYGMELKKALADAVLSGARGVTELAREHGIHPSLIHKWARQFREGGLHGSTFTSSDRERQRLERELARSQAKIGELLLENDLLKKFLKERASMRSVNGSVVSGRKGEGSEGGAA